MTVELGEVGIQTISVLVRPDVAALVRCGDRVVLPVGGWTIEGKVISVVAESVLIDVEEGSVRHAP